MAAHNLSTVDLFHQSVVTRVSWTASSQTYTLRISHTNVSSPTILLILNEHASISVNHPHSKTKDTMHVGSTTVYNKNVPLKPTELDTLTCLTYTCKSMLKDPLQVIVCDHHFCRALMVRSIFFL